MIVDILRTQRHFIQPRFKDHCQALVTQCSSR